MLKSGCKKTKQRVDVKQVAGSKEARARKRPVRFKVPANRRRRRRRLLHHRLLHRLRSVAGLSTAAAATTVRVEKHVRDDNEVSFFLFTFSRDNSLLSFGLYSSKAFLRRRNNSLRVLHDVNIVVTTYV